MTKLERLAREASKATDFRGHSLSPFRELSPESKYAECLTCGMLVTVNATPYANGAEITGNAVALNCPIEESAALDAQERAHGHLA